VDVRNVGMQIDVEGNGVPDDAEEVENDAVNILPVLENPEGLVFVVLEAETLIDHLFDELALCVAHLGRSSRDPRSRRIPLAALVLANPEG
jgi:hypothetical protein